MAYEGPKAQDLLLSFPFALKSKEVSNNALYYYQIKK